MPVKAATRLREPEAAPLSPFTGVILMPQGDKHMALSELIKQYETGRLQPPPHQRQFVWDKSKCRAWAETLIRAASSPDFARPIGAMVTYQLAGSGEYFLNDGWQRLNASMLFIREHNKYRLTQEQAESITNAYEVMVQHRHYQTQTEAMYWFQVLQLGTPLSNYEFCRGYLEYLDEKTNWVPTLNDFHAFMQRLVEPRIGKLSTAGDRVRPHIDQRHNYALLYRWLSRTTYKGAAYAKIASKTINLGDAERGRMIEQKLGRELMRLGLAQVLTEIKALEIFLEQEVAWIDEIWKLVHGQDKKISRNAFRWLLTMALWRRNHELPRDPAWRRFLELFILHCDYSGRITNLKSGINGEYVILSLDKLDSLSKVSEIIGYKFYLFYDKKD